MRSFVIATLATLALAGCGAPSTPDFVQKAAMSEMYEVQAGKLAAEKGQSDVVKQFGQCSYENHRGAYRHCQKQKYQGGSSH